VFVAGDTFVVVEDVVLYAQWKLTPVAVYYSVTYVGSEFTGGSVPVDNSSPYVSGSVVLVQGSGSMVKEGYSFLGWDTSSDADTVVYAAGSTFSIFKDTVLYAVWLEDGGVEVPVSYVVYYYLQGTETSLVGSKSGTGFVGDSVTESAVAIAGYTVVEPSSLTKTLDESGNVFVFYYTANTNIEYTVRYYLQGTTTSVAASKVVTGQTMATSVTENAITITGYTAVAPTSVTITLTATGNTITFYYTANSGSGGSGGGSSGGSGGSQVKPSTPPPAVTPPPETTPPPPPSTTPPVEPTEQMMWSLTNLVLSITGLLLAIAATVYVLMQKKNTGQKPLLKQRIHLWLFTALAMGILGVTLFLLTEDTSLPWKLVNTWTIATTIIFTAEIIALYFIFKPNKHANNKNIN